MLELREIGWSNGTVGKIISSVREQERGRKISLSGGAEGNRLGRWNTGKNDFECRKAGAWTKNKSDWWS